MKKVIAALLALWSSRKLWMTIFGVGVLYAIYRDSVYLLGQFPRPEQVVAFESLYQTAMYGIVTIVVGYTGFSTLQGFTRNTTSTALNVAQNLFSRHEEDVTIREERIFRVEKLDSKDLDAEAFQ